MYANSGDPYQKLCSVVSSLGQLCLSVSHKKDARLKQSILAEMNDRLLSIGSALLRFRGCWMEVFISNQILIEHSVHKQWGPFSDAVFCAVRSGSALFGSVPQKGR